jgi:hypothetical protein
MSAIFRGAEHDDNVCLPDFVNGRLVRDLARNVKQVG